MKKFLFFAVLLVLNVLLESCYGCKTPDCYDLSFSKIDNYNFRTDTVVESFDTIAVRDLALAPIAITRDVRCAFNLNFGGSLMADCAIAEFANRITNISITSSRDLNNDLPTDTELKQIFRAMEIPTSCLNEDRGVEECIRPASINEGESLERVFNRDFSFSFYRNPEQELTRANKNILVFNPAVTVSAGLTTFNVTFEFVDGKSIELVTPPIFLQ